MPITERVILRCPADPAELPTWLANAAARYSGRAVTLDLRESAEWLRAPADLVDLVNRLGMQVRSAYGARDALGADVHVLHLTQLLKPWCVLPEFDTLVIEETIRAGVHVQADGDVDVVRDLAPCSQIYAGGSVRILGRLGGRVVAGLASPDAVILCGCLEAEMVSINHLFLTGDKIDPSAVGRPCRIRVAGSNMVFEPVDYADIAA